MRRPNFRQGGFTLVELVFVIAIIVVLASIFLPLAISKLRKADEAVADASIQEIAAALTSFFEDLRRFPTCSSTDCDPFTASNNDLRFLAFGSGFGDLSASYPDTTTGTSEWNLTTGGSTNGHSQNNGANHLVVNDPVVGTVNSDGTDYVTTTSKSKRWRGPYIARVTVDSWGRTFIAHVGRMEASGTVASGNTRADTFGWILSGGPDNSLNTKPTSSTLQGDDRGFIFHNEP